MSAPLTSKWRKLDNVLGSFPRPRHGHRSVAIKDMMLVFGGGNEGIVDEMHVYRSSKCTIENNCSADCGQPRSNVNTNTNITFEG